MDRPPIKRQRGGSPRRRVSQSPVRVPPFRRSGPAVLDRVSFKNQDARRLMEAAAEAASLAPVIPDKAWRIRRNDDHGDCPGRPQHNLRCPWGATRVSKGQGTTRSLCRNCSAGKEPPAALPKRPRVISPPVRRPPRPAPVNTTVEDDPRWSGGARKYSRWHNSWEPLLCPYISCNRVQQAQSGQDVSA